MNETIELATKSLAKYIKYKDDEEFVNQIVQTFKSSHKTDSWDWFDVFKDEPIMLEKFQRIHDQMRHQNRR